MHNRINHPVLRTIYIIVCQLTLQFLLIYMPTPSPTSQREQQQQHQPHPAHHVLPRGDLARLCHAAADAAQEENRRGK